MAGGAFNLGDVFVTFVANTADFIAGLQTVATTAAEVGATASKSLDDIGVAGKEAGAGIKEGSAAAAESEGIFAGLTDTLKETVLPLIAIFGAYEGVEDILKSANTATNEWNNANVQVTNTLNQTHDAIGITSDAIKDMAEKFSDSTPITKGAQLQGEATLLTYQAIGTKIFPQVAAILPDVATAFANVQGRAVASSSDVAQAAKKLGVALTDPETGVNALTRAGIKFTAAQQDAIKTMQDSGNVLGAQQLLVNDFADMTAGKATASLGTYQGAVANAKKQFDDFTGNGIRVAQGALENLGNALLVFGSNALPQIEAVGQQVITFLTPSIVALWNAFKNLIPVLEQVWKQYLAPLVPIVGTTLVIAFDLLINALRIIIEVITDTTKFIMSHRVALVAVAGALATLAALWLVTAIPAAIAWAAAGVAAGLAWLAAAAPFIAIIAIGAALAAIAYEIVDHWSDVKQWFDDALQWFEKNWPLMLAILFGPFGLAVDAIIKYWHNITDFFSGLGKDILNAIGDLGSLLYDVGKAIIQGLINGVKDMAKTAENAVSDVTNGIKNVAKKVLGIFSPSTVFADIGQNVALGLAGGITGAADKVQSAATAMTNGMFAGTGSALLGSPSLEGVGSSQPAFTVSLNGAQIIGTVPQDVATKIGDAVVQKLKQTVRV